jgi:hypothetical protein
MRGMPAASARNERKSPIRLRARRDNIEIRTFFHLK